jgi:hypothetical protein
MFESSADTPTLGSALVSGGAHERVRVHALLQSLAATDASHADREKSKPRKKSNSCRVRKKSKKGQAKGSQAHSPRSSSRSRSQRSPRAAAAQAGGRRRTPASSPTLDPPPARPVEEEELDHEHHARLLTHHRRDQNLAPIRMGWAEGIEPTAAPSETLEQVPRRRDGDDTGSPVPPPPPQATFRSRTSVCREQEWEDLMGELHYHFGSSREAYYRSLAAQQVQPSTVLTSTEDHHQHHQHNYDSVLLAPPLPSEFICQQQQPPITYQRRPSEGQYLLVHW